jgi:SAM-dependent methyltransferase
MDNELYKAEQYARRLLQSRPSPVVLEAGCGARSMVTFPSPRRVIGVDISQEQLRRNDVISDPILGDLQRPLFARPSFDAIVCFDVLEHLPHPERAIENYCRWLAPGGVIVLGMPNVLSVKGLIAKATPHWVHVWIYRNIVRYELAGQPGCAPFPTHLKLAILPRTIAAVARKHGVRVRYCHGYESELQRGTRERFGLRGWRWKAIAMLCDLLSLGTVDARRSDYVMVLQKGPGTSAPAGPAAP